MLAPGTGRAWVVSFLKVFACRGGLTTCSLIQLMIQIHKDAKEFVSMGGYRETSQSAHWMGLTCVPLAKSKVMVTGPLFPPSTCYRASQLPAVKHLGLIFV